MVFFCLFIWVILYNTEDPNIECRENKETEVDKILVLDLSHEKLGDFPVHSICVYLYMYSYTQKACTEKKNIMNHCRIIQ